MSSRCPLEALEPRLLLSADPVFAPISDAARATEPVIFVAQVPGDPAPPDTASGAALVGDLNADGFVGAGDLDLLLGLWNQTVGPGAPADLTGDGFVGAGDLDRLLGNWNASSNGTIAGGVPLFAGQKFLLPDGRNSDVVAHDLDGDGIADLAAVSEYSGDVSVLLGNGDGTFQPEQRFGAGLQPRSLDVADFNADGVPDLVTANSGSNDVSVLLGLGDGSFSSAAQFGVGGAPYSVTVGDFNGDGETDLATANSGQYQAGEVSVLLGLGDAQFQAPQPFSVGQSPRAIVVGDFNGDGVADLATASLVSVGELSVLLGIGDGSFQGELRVAVGSSPRDVVSGDFNGDGLDDLAATNYASGDVSVLLARGDGTFDPQVRFAAGYGASSLLAVDVDGDGSTDLVSTNSLDRTVSVLLGQGNGDFLDAAPVSFGSSSTALAAGDFNGDGSLDLAIDRDDYSGASLTVLLGRGDGSFESRLRFDLRAYGAEHIAVADFNGDGLDDAALTTGFGNGSILGEDVSVLLNLAGGHFSFGVPGDAADVVTADFNGDGAVDLATANGFYGASVLFGLGNGLFLDAQRVTGPDSYGGVYLLTTGDFNGDGAADLATSGGTSSGTNNGVGILLGNGDGTFRRGPDASSPEASTPSGYAGLVEGDFNGDGLSDLAGVDTYQNRVSVMLGNGDGTFEAPRTFVTGETPRDVWAADLNGDGRTDLAIANSYGNDVSVLLGRADGLFTALPRVTVWSTPRSITAADFDGDGVLDLATANSYSDDVSVLIGRGDGRFEPELRFIVGDNPQSVAAADMNGDGAVDLLTANRDYSGSVYSREEVTVLLNLGGSWA